MQMQDIILKKRSGHALTTEEIDFFVGGYTSGNIPDYQAAALLMAVWFSQMDERETAALTKAIVNSGEIVDLSTIDTDHRLPQPYIYRILNELDRTIDP